MGVYDNMAARYESGQVPWDNELPPPEVLDFVPTLPPGRALDLGCGYGRASIFMAQAGWQVDAVDFVAQAVTEAIARMQAAGVTVNFHVGDVTDLHFLSGPYDYALDVGCAHALAPDGLVAYRDELRRLLRPGGYYMLFAHLREGEQPPTADQSRPRWMDEVVVQALFADGFELLQATYGITQVGDKPPWPSVWFLFRRQVTGQG